MGWYDLVVGTSHEATFEDVTEAQALKLARDHAARAISNAADKKKEAARWRYAQLVFLVPDNEGVTIGERPIAQYPFRKRASKPNPSAAAQWQPLRVGGRWNPVLLAGMDQQSGAYAVRDAKTKKVLYVGESHTGRMWRTLLRHFQDPTGKFARRGEWTRASADGLEARAWFTTEAGAECKEADLIASLKPLHNRTDGKCAADDFAFGANVANPSRPVVLGELVSIRYRPSAGGRQTTMRFPLRGPGRVLVAVRGNRLLLLYAATPTGASSNAGKKEYARLHWGKPGDGTALEGAILAGKAKKIGTATEITYGTRKGGDARTVNYHHVFGDMGGTFNDKVIRPGLEGGTCAGRAMVRLVGGSYTISAHGIVG